MGKYLIDILFNQYCNLNTIILNKLRFLAFFWHEGVIAKIGSFTQKLKKNSSKHQDWQEKAQFLLVRLRLSIKQVLI